MIVHFKKARRSGRKLRSESGQGVLEYILVLVIILVVILGLVYQFNVKFRNYAEQFFDGYIACLLETGELPGVGGSVCEEEMKTMADMQAKGLLKFPESGGGGGGDQKSPAQKAAEDAAKSGKQASKETLGGGGGGGGRSSNFGNFGRGGGRGRSTTVGQTAPSKNDSESVGYGTLSSPSGNFNGTSGAASKTNITYIYDADIGDDTSEKGKPPVAKTDKKAENSGALKPRRAIENTNRRSTASIDIAESDFSFGAMIRWLIIAALILAMVIFFGGQLMQIMRSREKGGD